MTSGPPWDTSTYEGYRAFLEHCRNTPGMVAEILSTYFPDGPGSPPRRRPEPGPVPPPPVREAKRRTHAQPRMPGQDALFEPTTP